MKFLYHRSPEQEPIGSVVALMAGPEVMGQVREGQEKPSEKFDELKQKFFEIFKNEDSREDIEGRPLVIELGDVYENKGGKLSLTPDKKNDEPFYKNLKAQYSKSKSEIIFYGRDKNREFTMMFFKKDGNEIIQGTTNLTETAQAMKKELDKHPGWKNRNVGAEGDLKRSFYSAKQRLENLSSPSKQKKAEEYEVSKMRDYIVYRQERTGRKITKVKNTKELKVLDDLYVVLSNKKTGRDQLDNLSSDLEKSYANMEKK